MPAPRIGYIGLDHLHRKQYLKIIQHLGMKVSAVCESNEQFDLDQVEYLGDRNEIAEFDDPITMLKEEPLDVVFITASSLETPHLIKAAADLGIDVYTEKPVARSFSELEPAIEAVNDSDITVAVSYCKRAHPTSIEARNLADSGHFGDIRAVEARFIAYDLAYRKTDAHIYDREASRGGVLQWIGVHYLDLIRWMLQTEFTRVTTISQSHTPDVDTEDGIMVLLETSSGSMVHLHSGYYTNENRYDSQLSVYGSDGTAEWDPIGDTFNFEGSCEMTLESFTPEWTAAPRRRRTFDYSPSLAWPGRWMADFVEQFFKARRGEATSPASLEDAGAILRVLDAAYEAEQADEWIDIKSE